MTSKANKQDKQRISPPDVRNVDAADLLKTYLYDIRPISSLLDKAEEQRLFRQIEEGKAANTALAESGAQSQKRRMQLEGQALAGKEAREKLFLANTRLVVSIAKRYQGLGLALPDLIQEGNLGLMKAIDRFDVSRGARLSTYATWWIRQTVARAVGNLGRTIRAPINQIQRAGKLKRIERKLTQSLKREPTLGELAEAADLTVDQTTYALRATRAPIDLDEWVSDDEEQRREELVADHASEDPESAAAEVLLKEAIWRVVDKLPGRLARIIDLRFGLTSGETQSLAQIGEKMGYSRERIRQLHHEALDQLRRIQDKHGLHEYLN